MAIVADGWLVLWLVCGGWKRRTSLINSSVKPPRYQRLSVGRDCPLVYRLRAYEAPG
jgi:hypothetical protein